MEYRFSRKIEGETYRFYTDDYLYGKYISVKTPKNAFGYPDTVLFTDNKKPYTLYRHLAPWKLRKIKQICESSGLFEEVEKWNM